MKLNEAMETYAQMWIFPIVRDFVNGDLSYPNPESDARSIILGALRWRPWPEEKPEAKKKVLVNVVLPNGKARRTCAVYFEENQLENDWEDYDGEDEFAPAGWYEEPLEFEGCRVLEGVTHFLPINGPEVGE